MKATSLALEEHADPVAEQALKRVAPRRSPVNRLLQIPTKDSAHAHPRPIRVSMIHCMNFAGVGES
jgi:hypothetical protein